MTWIEGGQNKKPKDPFELYEELDKIDGFIPEDQAKRYLYELMRQDITFTAFLLMGVKLAPHQHIAIKSMLENDYVLNIWGRGSAKTFTAAITAAAIALFNPGIEIGVLSKSFRQSKMLLKKLEDIAGGDGAAAFRDCMGKPSHRNDEWVIPIGKSKIYALPLGDGEKLRGFRFQCLIIDELLLMPEKILNEVILPFLGVVPNPTERQDIKEAEDFLIESGEMEEEERVKWPSNKFIGLSSASYKFEYLYELYQVYERLILGAGNDEVTEIQKKLMEKMKGSTASRAVIHLSYEAIPEYFYDQSLLIQAKETMSDAQFSREFKSVFLDDSGGFFNMKAMRSCSIADGESPSLKIKGSKGKKYLVAVDPSWGENSTSDDFAMQVLELNEEKNYATVVHSYARHGGRLKEHGAYLFYLLTNFDVVALWIDHGGGPQFINSCNEMKEFKDAKKELKIVEEDFDDVENYEKCIRNAKKLYNKDDDKIVFVRQFGKANWIRRANELLQSSLNHKKLWFGGRCMDMTYSTQLSEDIPIKNLVFNQPEEDEEYKETEAKAKKIELIEKQYDLLTLTKAECALIEVRSNPQGGQTFDLPQNLKRQKGINRTRRDSYTALLIGNWGASKWFDMVSNKTAPAQTSFMPFFVK